MTINYQPKLCSPQAKVKIKADAVDTVGVEKRLREKYPYSELEIGWCFVVPIAEVKNEMSFRVAVSTKGRHLQKKFTVIKHNDVNDCYEVARIG